MGMRYVEHDKAFINKLKVNVKRRIEEAGDEVKEKAKAYAPVASGALRNSIHTVTPSNDQDVNKKSILVGSNLDYAYLVEFGTRYKPARSFLRRALDSSKAAIQDIFKDT